MNLVPNVTRAPFIHFPSSFNQITRGLLITITLDHTSISHVLCFMLTRVRRPGETQKSDPRSESLRSMFCNIANSPDCCAVSPDLLFPLRIASLMRALSQVAANYRCYSERMTSPSFYKLTVFTFEEGICRSLNLSRTLTGFVSDLHTLVFSLFKRSEVFNNLWKRFFSQ